MSVVAGLTDTQESDLEAAYLQETSNSVARVKHLAADLGVRAPSVTLVMKALAARGLVAYERYGAITLTERGRTAGRELLLRRRATEDFLSSVLGVAPARPAMWPRALRQPLWRRLPRPREDIGGQGIAKPGRSGPGTVLVGVRRRGFVAKGWAAPGHRGREPAPACSSA